MGKFNRLSSSQVSTTPMDANRVVVNLSSKPLDAATNSVLAKGLNFAPTPRAVPIKDIICGVEQAIRDLPPDAAEEIRRETCLALKRTVFKSNLNKEEHNALRVLRADKDLVVLPADKGNAAVVLDSTTYKDKVTNLLSDPSYRKLDKDPTSRIENRTRTLLKRSELPTDIVKSLIPRSSVPPRLYGLPKIHKTDVPLRPIVSAIGSPTYTLAKHLTTLLQPVVGTCEHHVKNSTEFVKNIHNIKLDPQDILVSFDVVSLFTRVPLKDALQLLESNFTPDVIALFKHVLTSTYFLYDGQFYEQQDGVAMGSPLSPAIANFYMEHFEHLALKRTVYSPKYFYRYVDDTFVVWQHGIERLKDFLSLLNSIHSNIKFTMEIEKDGCLPFLDILICRKADGSLAHKVYRKPTHTDLYLNASSHHHPAQKRGILKTLVHRARSISDADSLTTEIQHLRNTFRQNGYSHKDIAWALRKTDRQPPTLSETRPKLAFIPYMPPVSNKIARLLHKNNIKTIHMPPPKVRQWVRPVKDSLGLRTPGIYEVPCQCGAVYIGQTGRTIEARCNEHKRCIRLGYPEKSAVAQHMYDHDHHINFQGVRNLGNQPTYWGRVVAEALEIKLHRNNYNRDNGLELSQAWNPAIRILQERSKSGPTSAPTNSIPAFHPGISGAPIGRSLQTPPAIKRSQTQN